MPELRSRSVKDAVVEKVADAVGVHEDDHPADGSTRAGAAAPVSKLPTVLQFPVVAVLSLVLSSLGYALLGAVTEGDLAAVARSTENSQDVAILTGWRV